MATVTSFLRGPNQSKVDNLSYNSKWTEVAIMAPRPRVDYWFILQRGSNAIIVGTFNYSIK